MKDYQHKHRRSLIRHGAEKAGGRSTDYRPGPTIPILRVLALYDSTPNVHTVLCAIL